MRGFETFVSRVTVAFGGLILCLMVVQIMLDVFMRQFAGAGFPATAELVAKYYMVAVSFLPIAFTEIKRRHVEATIFADALPARARPVLLFGGFALSLVIYALITFGTAREALRQTSQGAYVETGTMNFLTWPSYWILPVAFGLMSVVLLLRLVGMATGSYVDHAHDPLEELDSHAGETH
ncbi:C4-dicarboxylate ABC transporter [Zhengella mangrovi]|uniref:TRAP transporter small permease protein n=1 Tax=Zhengella mangrovi TaxID=1982044 RepID=A0A2G1QK89_9HYPH|nr:TRAP transporter small permease [Zhengella mangrovi]PHP65912.1 C4-dicarboxylate ABC transporter [Zhengella mangrovi]